MTKSSVRREVVNHGFSRGDVVLWNVKSATPDYEYTIPVTIVRVWRKAALVKIDTDAGNGVSIVQLRKLTHSKVTK